MARMMMPLIVVVAEEQYYWGSLGKAVVGSFDIEVFVDIPSTVELKKMFREVLDSPGRSFARIIKLTLLLELQHRASATSSSE